jgi:hypothetical protein
MSVEVAKRPLPSHNVGQILEIKMHRLCWYFTCEQDNFPFFINDKRQKKKELCSQYSGDVGVHIYHDKKRVTTI